MFLLKIRNLFITYGIADALKGDKSILITVYLGILFLLIHYWSDNQCHWSLHLVLGHFFINATKNMIYKRS